MLNILVCVKRVPAPGAKITLTEDERNIDTKHLGFAVSPHEECAVEEAIRQVEKHGGQSTVLTLGPEDALEQLREALAMGVDNAVLLETDGREWDPMATARAIVEAVHKLKEDGTTFDVLLFGNESADSGGYQVNIRVAQALGLPCVAGVKSLDIDSSGAVARREALGGLEIYQVPLPAVFTLKEGINLPRYPSLRGKLSAKKKPINRLEPSKNGGGLEKEKLRVPIEQGKSAEILGSGQEAVEKAFKIFKELGIV